MKNRTPISGKFFLRFCIYLFSSCVLYRNCLVHISSFSFFFCRTRVGGTAGVRGERSHSTSGLNSRFSLGAIYNRRSMPNQPRVAGGVGGVGGVGGAATNGTTSSNSAAYADEDDDGMEIDATDMDMFTRKSIAMFERYNKEQVSLLRLCNVLSHIVLLIF